MESEGKVDRHPHSQSALHMVTSEPVLNEFVVYLREKKKHLLEKGHSGEELVFYRSQIEDVQAVFVRMIQRGEEKLHRLCGLLSDAFFQDSVALKSVVIAQLPDSNQRLKLIQDLSKTEVYARTDLDLGNWLLSRMRYQVGSGWEQPKLVANFVEYQPLVRNALGVTKMISRIKAEEEIWAKVVDEIFELDKLVEQDKQLRSLSRFVKDVFGVKIVVESGDEIQAVLDRLKELRWSSETLAQHGVVNDDSTQSIEFIEIKNHTRDGDIKRSGWQALKAVISWWNKTMEIQIQTLDIYLREQELLTRESHTAFKENREKIRHQVADQLPLFGFYVKLLKWLFINPNEPPPELEGLNIVIRQE